MAEVGSAFVSILPSAKGFGSKLDSQVGGDIKSSGGRMGKVFGGAMKVGLLAAGAGLVAVGGAFVGAMKAAAESEKITAQTAAVLKSTGGVANVSAKQVQNLGNEISAYSGMADESVREGQNMLLTFTKVRNEAGKGNDVFNQATKSIADMSVALGTDMKGSALQVGKALNDPTKGVTALSRAGVSFTQQQKDQIKAMQESGDMLGAQKMILGELETQFGGAAKAAGDTFAGSMNKLKNAFGDTLRDAVMPLLPHLTRFATFLAAHLPGAINNAINAVKNIVNALRPFGAVTVQVFGVVRSVFSRFTSDSSKASGTFGRIMAAISGYVRTHFKAVRTIITDVMKVVARVVDITTKVMSRIWGRFGKDILRIATAVFKAVGGVISGAMKAIGGIVKLALAVLRGDWSGAWRAIRQIVAGVWQAISAIIRGAFSTIRTIMSASLRLARDAMSAGLGRIVDLVKSIPGRVTSALGSLGSTLRDAGAQLIQGLIDGIMSKIGAIGDAMGSVGSKIKGFLPGSPVKEGPLTSWNRGAAGKRLVDLLAFGITADPVADAMERALAPVSIPRPRLGSVGAYAGAGAAAGRGVEIHQHFPTTSDPQAAYDAAGGRVVSALSAVGA